MNNPQPYFTVVTPTYDRARFLAQMVESVQGQTHQNYEHIIVDDGSTDNSLEILKKYSEADPRIRIVSQENKGRSVARNIGIEAAQGQYICFLDSDDIWLPNHLLKIYEFIGGSSEPAFYFTGLSYQFADHHSEKRFPPLGSTLPIDYIVGEQVSTITVAIHRSILNKHRFNPELFINEDLELWARIVSEFPMRYIDEVNAVAVQHGSNTASVAQNSIVAQKRAMELVFSNESLRPFFSNEFRKRKQQSLLELSIRSNQHHDQRAQLIKNISLFLLKYPNNPGNKAKLVSLLYALPGGQILKHIVRGSKRP